MGLSIWRVASNSNNGYRWGSLKWSWECWDFQEWESSYIRWFKIDVMSQNSMCFRFALQGGSAWRGHMMWCFEWSRACNSRWLTWMAAVDIPDSHCKEAVHGGNVRWINLKSVGSLTAAQGHFGGHFFVFGQLCTERVI